MSTSEIAKLESLWRENPQGLTFTPLAEAYRRMKEPQRALELVSEGIAARPQYVPAVIVLGRCHLDLGDDAAAEQAFLRVLALDSENVIGLKALAEINERHSRFGESARWLKELLLVDRSNDEARAHLARVEEAERKIGAEAVDSGEERDSRPGLDADEAPDRDADEDAELPPVAMVADQEPETPVAEAIAPNAEAPASPVESAEFAPLRDGIAGDEADDAHAADSGYPDTWAPEPEERYDSSSTPDPAATFDAASPYSAADHGLGYREFQPADDEVAFASPDVADEVVADAAPLIAAAAGDVTAIEPAADLELHSSGASEFQIGSDSDDLGGPLGAEAARGSQYQSPDAAADLMSGYDLAAADDEPLQASIREDLIPDPIEQLEPAAPPPEPEQAEVEPAALEFHPATSIDADSEAIADLWPAAAAESDSSEAVAEHSIASVGAGDDEYPGEDVDDAAPELVVTESMAELYLRQGHRTDALTIYRELYLRNPAELRLREKVDELETEAAAIASGEPLPNSYAAAGTGGQPVSRFLQRLLAARPAAASAWSPPPPRARYAGGTASNGEPTRPADDRLSLSAIFGDDSSPVPPAVGSAGTADAGAMSFDDFFDSPSAAESAGRRPLARDDDDLDQFHAWLHNLKR